MRNCRRAGLDIASSKRRDLDDGPGRLPDSSLGVGFIDHVDGLEMFGFRKGFRGLDRCGKLVKLHLVPLAVRIMRVRPLGCSRSIADGPYSTRT